MALTLGPVTFDEAHTTVKEKLEEVGGRNERRITVSGLIVGPNTVTAVEAEMDAVLDAASVEDFTAELSLRTGRRFLVRRNAFSREINRESLVGSFVLELAAQDPFETSTGTTSVPWTIAASGAQLIMNSAGNAPALPRFTVIATGTIVDPTFSDGSRILSLSGTVQVGEKLIIDSEVKTMEIDGVDVLPYATGDFPEIAPETTTWTYTDDPSSSHTASATVVYRDRWW